MEFLKKHYEKILLTLVLASLLGAAGYLLLQVQSVKEDIARKRAMPSAAAGAKAPAIPATKFEELIAKSKKPSSLDLSQGNLVFNPGVWKANSTNLPVIFPGGKVGPSRLHIKSITALNLIVDGVVTVTADKLSYDIGVTKEHDKNPLLRKRTRRTATLNVWTVFDRGTLEVMLKEVKMEGDNPQFTIDLKTAAETVNNITFTKAAPYKKIMGYSADIEYPPQNVTYPVGRREGDEILIDGEAHIIIAIREKEVTVEAKSNKKRTVVTPKLAP